MYFIFYWPEGEEQAVRINQFTNLDEHTCINKCSTLLLLFFDYISYYSKQLVFSFLPTTKFSTVYCKDLIYLFSDLLYK